MAFGLGLRQLKSKSLGDMNEAEALDEYEQVWFVLFAQPCEDLIRACKRFLHNGLSPMARRQLNVTILLSTAASSLLGRSGVKTSLC